ncbi:hypothetical protein O0L34_g17848 [Tuta absoluta]|nr:hypothetical protein O0L34_g17848 [Tuta absoluta]
MSTYAPLSTVLRAKIIVLYEDNLSISAISRRLQLNRRTVTLWVKRYADTGDILPARKGRKAVMFTDASARHRGIVAKHANTPFLSTRSTAAEFGVTLQTVRTHLHAAGISCYRPAHKILLSAAHQQARVQFAHNYRNFDWENNVVIFTDEKAFKSDKDGRKILWRRRGERYRPIHILPNRMSGRITLGFWGWMSSMGPGELVEIEGRFNSESYVEILRDVMMPTVRIAYPNQHIYFVHDNCSVHKARIVQDWLQTQRDVTVINWPSKSPDLNPIENLWGQMVLNWDPSEVRTKENLRDLAMFTWESMRGKPICSNMVASMPSRLEQIESGEGAPLRY